MDGMDAGVIDAPDVDLQIDAEIDDGGALDTAADTQLDDAIDTDSSAQEQVKDDPYTTKFSREYRAALKALETAHPEQAKFLKQARDNHARLFALTQVEPNGIDGVREKYALLDSVIHGELKGTEAIAAMQEYMHETEQTDQLLAAGDPKALEALGPDFDPGLAKLAPAILDRVRASNPEAYEAAVMPHLVGMLATSELVKDYNSLVDVLNISEKDDPRFDVQTKLRMTVAALAKMGGWLNDQQQKAGSIKAPAQNAQRDEFEQERTQFEQERQQAHWDTKIKPQAAQHENAKFEELFKPYQTRLKLDAAAKEDLMQAFKGALNRAGSSDAEYMRQMKIYRSQKNPDPTAVANFVKNAINKHSKTAMESLINARYKSFLNGKPRTVAATGQPGTKQGPVSPGVEIRSVKPPMEEIDHRNTPLDWLAQKKYRLNNGKIVQVRQQ